MTQRWFMCGSGDSLVVRWPFFGGSCVSPLVGSGPLLVLRWFVVNSLDAGPWVLRICCCRLAAYRCWLHDCLLVIRGWFVGVVMVRCWFDIGSRFVHLWIVAVGSRWFVVGSRVVH